MKFTHLLAFAAIVALAFSACKKEKDESDNDFQVQSEEIGKDESISADLDKMTSQCRTGSFTPVNDNNLPDQFRLWSCATVTNDSVNRVLTFDFGTGCTGLDGTLRAGKVIVNYTGTGYFDPGSSWVMTFDSFYVNTRHVEGTRTVTNNGLNSAGLMNWTINATNMRITKTDGSWRTWDSQRTRTMIAGLGDSTYVNDIYEISGTTTGNNSNGVTFNNTFTNLKRDLSCSWITSGIMTITRGSRPTMTMDFGNGTCDDEATVTRNGITRTIHLRP